MIQVLISRETVTVGGIPMVGGPPFTWYVWEDENGMLKVSLKSSVMRHVGTIQTIDGVTFTSTFADSNE